VKKYLLLSVLVIAFFALSLGTANAVWKIGGTGPFLNYPFYVEGAADGVNFKTYLVVNNTDISESAEIVSLIHYVISDNNADGFITMLDLGCNNDPNCPWIVDSEETLRDFHLTPTESRIIVPGITNPALGPEVLIWSSSQFQVGWVELWAYSAGSSPPKHVDCDGVLRGEGITIDLASSSAWSYKAVASVQDHPNDGLVRTSVVAPECIDTGNPDGFDVWWKEEPLTWNNQFELPTGYNHLASSYNLDLWVKSPAGGTPQNNTIMILTNPNHRKLAGSTNTCRDCTHVSVNLYNAAEESDHKEFDLCEMRVLSIRNDFSSTIVHGDIFYGWGTVAENDSNINDTIDGYGCTDGQWTYPIRGTGDTIDFANNTCCSNNGSTPECVATMGTGPQAICGLLNVNDLSKGCLPCDVDNDGFLAVSYTSWKGSGPALTYWGNNLFNDCGDAAGWGDWDSDLDEFCPGNNQVY